MSSSDLGGFVSVLLWFVGIWCIVRQVCTDQRTMMSSRRRLVPARHTSFTQSHVLSLTHSQVTSLTHRLHHSLIHWLRHLLTGYSTHSFTGYVKGFVTDSLTGSVRQSQTASETHRLTYSLTSSATYTWLTYRSVYLPSKIWTAWLIVFRRSLSCVHKHASMQVNNLMLWNYIVFAFHIHRY